MSSPTTPPYHLPTDAVWFITGCSTGIGRALAQRIAQTPHQRLVATARNPATLSTLPDSANVLKLALDVTSAPSIDSAISATIANFTRIDVVVNNAGYTLVGDTEAAGDAEARTLLDTNFWGMVDVTKRAIGVMRDTNGENGAKRGGVVLNMSSLGGWCGFAGTAFYHASKFAMEGWTESVARELPEEWNIHLSILEPGAVRTNAATTSLKQMEKRHPAYASESSPTNAMLAYVSDEKNRASWAEPEDVAMAVYGLVSRGQRIPLRVPLGPDAWGMIMKDIEDMKKDLDEVKDVSFGVGRKEQGDKLGFLKEG